MKLIDVKERSPPALINRPVRIIRFTVADYTQLIKELLELLTKLLLGNCDSCFYDLNKYAYTYMVI